MDRADLTHGTEAVIAAHRRRRTIRRQGLVASGAFGPALGLSSLQSFGSFLCQERRIPGPPPRAPCFWPSCRASPHSLPVTPAPARHSVREKWQDKPFVPQRLILAAAPDEAGLAEQKNHDGECNAAEQDQPVPGVEAKDAPAISTGKHDRSDSASCYPRLLVHPLFDFDLPLVGAQRQPKSSRAAMTGSVETGRRIMPSLFLHVDNEIPILIRAGLRWSYTCAAYGAVAPRTFESSLAAQNANRSRKQGCCAVGFGR